jgi:hypothetical protein
MSILLFEDFTKLYKRWNKGEDRKEDEFHSNIDDFKTVDLGKEFPVLFADVDLIVNGNDKFLWDEVILMIEKIKKTDWRLPNYSEMRHMFYKEKIQPKPKNNVITCWYPEKYGSVQSKETGEILYFPTDKKYGEAYWICTELLDPSKIAKGLHVGNPRVNDGCLIRVNTFDSHKETYPAKIRLVKDKYKKIEHERIVI